MRADDVPRIRALIADDEPLARINLKVLIEARQGWCCAAEAANGSEVFAAVAAEPPDVIFLDVRMPGLDGVEIARRLAALAKRPALVFVTAFREHAVDAFELEATDYLLKPFDEARFERTANRIESRVVRLREPATPPSPEGPGFEAPPTAETRPAGAFLEQLVVRSLHRTRFVSVDDLVWIASEGNYVRLYLRDSCLLHRAPLGSLEKQLDPSRFLRVQRRAIVNRGEIAELRSPVPGRLLVVLRDGSEVEVSQRFSRRVHERLAVRSSS